jgi:phosphotransferase system HPr (HPr) family protein
MSPSSDPAQAGPVDGATAGAGTAGAARDARPAGAEEVADAGTTAVERTVVLPVDLHARPAGRVARAAAGFGATVTLVAGERSADARSMLAVMGLTATSGTEVIVRAAGVDAETAVEALAGILSSAP